MTESVNIEPAPVQRSAFAMWCLAQDPQLSFTGPDAADVPLDLYPTVPTDLLIGAYVDGYAYRHVIEGFVPDGTGYKPEVPVQDGAQPEPVAPLGRTKNGTPRKRRAPSAPKDDVTAEPEVEVSE